MTTIIKSNNAWNGLFNHLGSNRDNTYEEFMTPFDRMFDEIFNQNPFFNKRYGPKFFERGSYPKVDICESSTSISIEAAVPGMTRDEISIDVQDNVLTISGNKQTKDEDDSQNRYSYRELKRSSFRRSWTLPDYLDQDTITASLNEGILTVTIQRKEPEESKLAPIKIKIE